MISEPPFDRLCPVEGGPVVNDDVILELALISSDVTIEDLLVCVGVEVADVLRENGTITPYRAPYMDCGSEVGYVVWWSDLATSDPDVIASVTKHHGALVHEHVVVGIIVCVLSCPGPASRFLTRFIDDVDGRFSLSESELTTIASDGSVADLRSICRHEPTEGMSSGSAVLLDESREELHVFLIVVVRPSTCMPLCRVAGLIVVLQDLMHRRL